MPQYLEVLDFPLDPSIHICLVHFPQIDNLHGNLVASQRMCRNFR